LHLVAAAASAPETALIAPPLWCDAAAESAATVATSRPASLAGAAISLACASVPLTAAAVTLRANRNDDRDRHCRGQSESDTRASHTHAYLTVPGGIVSLAIC
jgi:hypothetical protein